MRGLIGKKKNLDTWRDEFLIQATRLTDSNVSQQSLTAKSHSKVSQLTPFLSRICHLAHSPHHTHRIILTRFHEARLAFAIFFTCHTPLIPCHVAPPPPLPSGVPARPGELSLCSPRQQGGHGRSRRLSETRARVVHRQRRHPVL